MIYTVGDKFLYEGYFRDHAPEPTYKAIGGSVWRRSLDVVDYAKLSPSYGIYALWGDWDEDTKPTAHSWNELIRPLIIVESLLIPDVVIPTDLVGYLKAKGYVVKKVQKGWSCSTPLGYSILRGWAKSETDAWKHCWKHMIREARW